MLTRIEIDCGLAHGVELYLLEDRQTPPVIRGNKRFKLADWLTTTSSAGFTQILSFGGAYSNHIHALAWAARAQGLRSVGIIRGEPSNAYNPTLSDARRWGMQLEFVSRADYRNRHNSSWLQALQARFPDARIQPEGGATIEAIRACRRMLDGLDTQNLDVLACAVGTGATVCGLSLALNQQHLVRGYSVVSDSSREARIRDWLDRLSSQSARLKIVPINQPRYGRLDAALCEFIDDFFCRNAILLDPVYTGKMLRQLMYDINNGQFARGSTIVAVHTGGLQGWRGFLPEWASRLSSSTLSAVRQQSTCADSSDPAP